MQLESSFIRAGAVFKEPILSWTADVPSRFFKAVYSSLNELLYIQPSDLVATAGVSLGDCSVAIRIFGGNSTLTLKANGVVAEFPNIGPDKIEFVNTVILKGYEALRMEFSEIEISSIESNAGYHLKLGKSTAKNEIFKLDNQSALNKRAQEFHDVVVEPAQKFRVISKDGDWSTKVTLEKSEQFENGIFLLRELVVSNLSNFQTTQQQFDLIYRIDQIVLRLAGLKSESQDSNAD